MKSKLLVTIFIAVLVLFVGCDSFWQVSDTSDITFTIDTSALQSSRSIQFSQNGVNAIDSDDVSKITVSLHNASDDSEIASITETLSEDGKAELKFKNLRIVGKTVYAKAVLEKDGEVKAGRSEAKRMVRGSNSLHIVKWEELEPVHAVQPVFASTLQSTTYTTNAQPVALNGTATVTDGGAITYQWYRSDTNSTIGGTAINSATSETYMPPTDAVGTVYYYVIATSSINDNGDGGVKTATATSTVATIEVNNKVNALPPSITELLDATYIFGAQANPLNGHATVTDAGILTYQWYRNDTNSTTGGTVISGATTETYTPPTHSAGTVYYYVVATNTISDNGDGGVKVVSTPSNVGTIVVNEPVHAVQPVFTTTLQNATYIINAQASPLNGSATITDGGTITYQWYRNDSNSIVGGTSINGATGETYTPPTNEVGTVYYYVIATNTIADNNDGGVKTATATSNIATIVVAPFEDYMSKTASIRMIAITGTGEGTFMMGSANDEVGVNDDEKPEHSVTLNSFYLGSTEVTEAQWEAVMTDWPAIDPLEDPSGFSSGDSYPARYINWYDAITFCNKLSIEEGLTPVYSVTESGVEVNWETITAEAIPDDDNTEWNAATYNENADGYRLPTEAEWEYAAGGAQETPTTWAGTSDVNELGTYAVYFPSSDPSIVESKSPVSEEYALYDMSGNVSEWCYDWYDADYYDPGDNTDNPTGPAEGSGRVLRGNYWGSITYDVRVAYRGGYNPSIHNRSVGFRVARNAN